MMPFACSITGKLASLARVRAYAEYLSRSWSVRAASAAARI
jgi:hypothetical protein